MKFIKDNRKIFGWIFFVISIGLVCLQLGYLFIHDSYQVEYVDNRLFYLITILCVISLFLAILLLVNLGKKYKLIGAGLLVMFIVVNILLLVDSNKEIKNITSLSPNLKQVLSIKENVASGEVVYYRSYYGIFVRPKSVLQGGTDAEYKVEWLANDIAAVTYQSADNSLQQFIATYGDRGSGINYYYVGSEIHGKWQGEAVEVISGPDGITVTEHHNTELFPWENIEQFGTLAVVLKKNNEPIWTISLDENFDVHSDATEPTVGNISLYKTTMEENEPIKLAYKGEYQ
ncbi:hypothetical protein [Ornithinibacillus contaminans]|uniref:hypothetical protein n=1 Tax=Ornithinibacillus contaminans TaxID=694055 RepID=UPI00064DBF9F|nr:hypothetical protein [Ornithinibacillus contaminans]